MIEPNERRRSDQGFSLIEVLVALLITMVVMASVFLLLQQAQDAFRREPELSALTGNARTGLTRITQELAVAGYATPATLPVVWQDGGGDAPDVLTIVYGDSDAYVSRPIPCAAARSSVDSRTVPSRGNALDGSEPRKWLARAVDVFVPGIDPGLLAPERAESVVGMQRRRRRAGGESTRSRSRGDGVGGPSGPSGEEPSGPSGGASAASVPCGDVGRHRGFRLDPSSVQPQPLDFETIYPVGTELMALQGPMLDDPRCDTVRPAIMPVTVVSEPVCTGAGGVGGSPVACGQLALSYTPRPMPELDLPPGFEHTVDMSCATVGVFHVVQYRVDPGRGPEASPSLDRRDLLTDSVWRPLAGNIENLQIQYAQGIEDRFEDEPARLPIGIDPDTFVTRVRVTVAGRSASANLAGATAGARAADGAHLRRSFSTTVSLRNQLNQAQQKADQLGFTHWN